MRIVDLFSGCGGFSLGARNAGFDVVMSMDIDPILASSYSQNFPTSKLILGDVATLTGSDCISATEGQIDGIIGGPPCQGFSSIGKRDERDPRRELLTHFFRVISEVAPKFFVMENVEGLRHKSAKPLLDHGISLVDDIYHIFGPTSLNAADFGAATKRTRVFVIGLRKDLGKQVTLAGFERYRRPATTVQEAISDLAKATLHRDRKDGFQEWMLPSGLRASEYAKRLRSKDRTFTGHGFTKHTTKVVERFSSVVPGTTDKVGRHYRLAWQGQCPTLRAGTGSDKGSFQSVRPIHPTEHRVITAREGARLQGFPDDHLFHPTVWHSFRMIGNSVSPIMAEVVLRVVGEVVSGKMEETPGPSAFIGSAA